MTDWKKNLDSRYISGEDLFLELNGFKKSMVVSISGFKDSEVYDQKAKENIIQTELKLQTADGKPLYKGTILNKTNGKVLFEEFKTRNLEDWVGKLFVMKAVADRRHGQVVRFAKYYPPRKDVFTEEKLTPASTAIIAGTYKLEQVKKDYQITDEMFKKLEGLCQKK